MSDNLPRKVLIEILARLPVKSLLRFRCVCKSWRSLISTPALLAAHINHHSTISSTNNTRLLLLRHYSHCRERFSLHSDNETLEERGKLKSPSVSGSKLYFRVVGSCNGLVCLTDYCFGYTNTIILWNPSIRRSLTLPLPKITLDSDGPLMCVHGFGVDLNENDHKVVRISYLEGEDGFIVPPREICTLKKQSWRDFEGFVPKFGISDYFWSQAYLIGKVHWVAYKLFDRVTSGCFILLFDSGDEFFSEMELPQCLVHEFPRNMVTKVMGESLSVIQNDARAYSKRCAIWVMKEYGVVESWIKLYDMEGW